MQPDRMDLEKLGADLVERCGLGARGWLGEVPALAARLAGRWDLTLGEMFAGGAYSVVLRYHWPDGTPAVLKLSPDRAQLTEQAEMLRVFAPSGRVPAVLATDAEIGAMALAEIHPGTEARGMPSASLPGLWGELLAALHAVTPPAGWPRDLRGRCAEAFDRIGRKLSEPAVGERIDQATWQRTVLRCQRLLNTQARSVLLHGDLHPGNALDAGPSRGLVAIDPKACIGDPCFDAVHYVVEGAGHEGVEARCQLTVTACGLNGDRLYAWSRVVAPVRAITYLTDDGPAAEIDELLALAN
ncbi:MAG: phosphotransferase [Pseudonocardiaceae bacterium]